MKKILFIISNLESGGVSKSITSLMNVIDREKYDVAIMVLSYTGPFISLLPKNLRIITNPIWKALTGQWNGFKYLLKKKPILALGHAYRMLLSRFSKSMAGELLAKLMPALDEDFDVVVDFNGQHQLYYMVNKIKSKKKITFFHSDYSEWPYYFKADMKYFSKVDNIFTISDHCVSVLKEWFPQQKDKIDKMENISSLSLIEKMSQEKVNDMDLSLPAFVTIGHVSENKGSDLAIKAAYQLKKNGLKFHWYFIGSNENSRYFDSMVSELEVSDEIMFLGVKTNPYPYIKDATIIVHPSRFEGKSIALDEAKLLCKPIVVTNFSTVNDQFTDGENAIICAMEPYNLADSISDLLKNYDLREKFINNLKTIKKDNSSELNKLYNIFDS